MRDPLQGLLEAYRQMSQIGIESDLGFYEKGHKYYVHILADGLLFFKAEEDFLLYRDALKHQLRDTMALMTGIMVLRDQQPFFKDLLPQETSVFVFQEGRRVRGMQDDEEDLLATLMTDTLAALNLLSRKDFRKLDALQYYRYHVKDHFLEIKDVPCFSPKTRPHMPCDVSFLDEKVKRGRLAILCVYLYRKQAAEYPLLVVIADDKQKRVIYRHCFDLEEQKMIFPAFVDLLRQRPLPVEIRFLDAKSYAYFKDFVKTFHMNYKIMSSDADHRYLKGSVYG